MLLDRSWLATVHDVSSGTHHVINLSRPSPCFSYCKRQKLGMEAWERGYLQTTGKLLCDGSGCLLDGETPPPGSPHLPPIPVLTLSTLWWRSGRSSTRRFKVRTCSFSSSISARLAKAGRYSRVKRGTGRSLGLGSMNESELISCSKGILSGSPPNELLEQRAHIRDPLSHKGECAIIEQGLQLLLQSADTGSRPRHS